MIIDGEKDKTNNEYRRTNEISLGSQQLGIRIVRIVRDYNRDQNS